MGDAFLGGHEPGPHLHARGAQGCCGHVAAGVDDAAGCDHRDGDGPNYLGHQDHGGDFVDAAQASALKSLGDDHVHSLGLRAAGVPHRGDLVDDCHPVFFQGAGIQSRASSVGDCDVDALLGCSLNHLLYLGMG